jgi:dihydropteroate synthase
LTEFMEQILSIILWYNTIGMSTRLSKTELLKWRRLQSRGSTGTTNCGTATFRWGDRTYVMGILNVSPDSFSGDGVADIGGAVEQAQRFVAEGVDIIDIGGESTRPGTTPQSTEEVIDTQLARVIPVLKKLLPCITMPVSIDTYHYEVARQALDAGAVMINDIWGLEKEPRLANLAAERNTPIILMANHRDRPQRYIMPSIIKILKKSIDKALNAGIPWDNIIIDPGIGFGKTVAQNLEIIRRLNELKILGRPMLLATSRKSAIGLTLNVPPDQRLEGTAATIAIGINNGADMVRVHDVPEMIRICRMSDAIVRRGKSS